MKSCYWILATTFLVLTVEPSRALGESDTNSIVSADWIYHRQYETYWSLFMEAKLTEEDRSRLQHQAYYFYFEYWILHRSKHAQLHPVDRFEESFSRLLKKHVVPMIDEDDPVRIKKYYRDGQFVPEPLPKIEGFKIVASEEARLPDVEGLPRKNLKTWDAYQGYVKEFKTFIKVSADRSLPRRRTRERGQ